MQIFCQRWYRKWKEVSVYCIFVIWIGSHWNCIDSISMINMRWNANSIFHGHRRFKQKNCHLQNKKLSSFRESIHGGIICMSKPAWLCCAILREKKPKYKMKCDYWCDKFRIHWISIAVLYVQIAKGQRKKKKTRRTQFRLLYVSSSLFFWGGRSNFFSTQHIAIDWQEKQRHYEMTVFTYTAFCATCINKFLLLLLLLLVLVNWINFCFGLIKNRIINGFPDHSYPN